MEREVGRQKRKMHHRTVGYLRVSTEKQEVDKNKADILTLANNKHFGNVEWVEETASGAKYWKDRQIKPVIDSLQAGDKLIVPELSRLGRSMLEIMEMLSVLRSKDVCVYAVKGSWELNGTLQSKVMARAFSMAAEIERDLISSRTKEALKARKLAGVILGRPRGPGKSKLDKYREEIIALLKNGSTKAFISRRYQTTEPNLYNWLKKNKIIIKPDISPVKRG